MAVAPIALGVAAGAALVGAYLQAEAAKDSAEVQAQQAFDEKIMLEDDARLAKTQAIQEEVARREQLRSILSAQASLSAATGSSVSSGDVQTLGKRTRYLAERDIENVRIIGNSKYNRMRMAANSASNRVNSALKAGKLGALGAWVAGVGQAASYAYGGYTYGQDQGWWTQQNDLGNTAYRSQSGPRRYG